MSTRKTLPNPQTLAPSSGEPTWLLRRADQGVVAACVAVGVAALGIWLAARGGMSGRTIDIDEAPPLSAAFQVDVNRADWPELAQLPGIGEKLAKRIVEARVAGGAFRDVEDLRRVRGIGAKTLERLRPYVVLPADDQAVAAK